MLTNPPFMRDPKQPPFHLRDLTAEELQQWLRMRSMLEQLAYDKRKPELQRVESL